MANRSSQKWSHTNSGANKLFGLAGNDTLGGGQGDDILTGGIGKDALNGGAVAGTFVFALGDITASTSKAARFALTMPKPTRLPN